MGGVKLQRSSVLMGNSPGRVLAETLDEHKPPVRRIASARRR